MNRPADDIPRQGSKRLCLRFITIQGTQRHAQQLGQPILGRYNTNDRRISRLLALFMARLGPLPHRNSALSVHDIVCDLECQAEIFPVVRNPDQILTRRPGDKSTDARRRQNQRAGFSNVNQLDGGQIDLLPFRFEVERLPPTRPMTPAAWDNSRMIFTASSADTARMVSVS